MGQKHSNSNEWNVIQALDSAQTDTSLKAAPGTGMSYYVTDVELMEGGTSRLNRLHNATTAAAGNTIWGATPAANGQISCHFTVPIKVGSNLPLLVTSAGTSTGGFLLVNGFTARG